MAERQKTIKRSRKRNTTAEGDSVFCMGISEGRISVEKNVFGKGTAAQIGITFYVAECMEFVRYGEYAEGFLSLKEALECYDKIPMERLNAGKGIGIHVDDPEEGMVQVFPLLMGNTLDLDLLQMIGSRYPQIMDCARELIQIRKDIKILDSQGILKDQATRIDAEKLAKRINALQRILDPDSYDQLYPDTTVQEKKIMMGLLTENGREDYQNWLKTGNLILKEEYREEAEEIQNLLQTAEIQWPEVVTPFVSICWSESLELEDGDVLPLEEADAVFERLDRAKVQENKENGDSRYYKTKFVLYYQINGEPCTYEGRQDFGDGDGSLIEHIEKFAKFYLETEEGQQILNKMKAADRDSLQKDCIYIREEMIPYLKYYCNLHAIERAVLEEQEAERAVPVVTDRQEARREYQRDLLAFIQESRRALNQGGSLPVMPDIKDYEETKEKRAYREHVMKEIAEEAKEYGMTVEEYAKNGYEPMRKQR